MRKGPDRMGWLVFRARQLFYRAGGPWWRARLAEALGSERFSKPALSGIDDALAPWLPATGVFVEAGAHDGFTQSSTYYLERCRGWSGVLVEAIPELAAKARRRRPRSKVFNYALVADAKPGQVVTLWFGGLMSVVANLPGAAEHAAQGTAIEGRRSYEIEVPARTLTAVLDEAGVPTIDLFVLDVEGHEMEVLKGLDLDRFAPKLLLIEMLQMAEQRLAFDAYLGDRYQPTAPITHCDMLYVRRD